MTSSEKSWRRVLVDAHPDLFRVDHLGDSHVAGYPAVGDGWQDLLERLVARIVAADAGRSVSIDEIKSKYGTLRLYWSGTAIDDATDAAIEEAVALAEARSECTCETCGREGRVYSDGSWLTTACPDHARGEPVPVRPGDENIHIVTTYEGDWKSGIRCRRYSRETDTFADVDPATLGITDS